MENLVVATTAIKEQVSTLSGFSVEQLMARNLQKLTKAYKEDKSHVATYTPLRQG